MWGFNSNLNFKAKHAEVDCVAINHVDFVEEGLGPFVTKESHGSTCNGPKITSVDEAVVGPGKNSLEETSARCLFTLVSCLHLTLS